MRGDQSARSHAALQGARRYSDGLPGSPLLPWPSPANRGQCAMNVDDAGPKALLPSKGSVSSWIAALGKNASGDLSVPRPALYAPVCVLSGVSPLVLFLLDKQEGAVPSSPFGPRPSPVLELVLALCLRRRDRCCNVFLMLEFCCAGAVWRCVPPSARGETAQRRSFWLPACCNL